MALDNQTYYMHKQSVEGEVFYKNQLMEPEYVKTYFPIGVGEETYDQNPHISFPVTSDVLNRIVNLLHNGMEVSCDIPVVQDKLIGLFERNDWQEFSRGLIIKSLSGGNFLVVFRVGWGESDNAKQVIYFETWPGKFIYRDNYFMSSPTLGYMYLWKDGKRQPILSKPTDKDFEEGRVRVYRINKNYWYMEDFSGEPIDLEFAEHDFGFTPAFFMRAVDKDDDGRYGIPYHFRYRENNIEYNQIYSQASLAMLVLQNVWVTDQQIPNPRIPLRLAPNKINFVGEGGKLEQAVRNLNLEPEFGVLDRLRNHIAVSGQVPEFFTGLKSVGKIQSGVALSIVAAPLDELMNRIRGTFKPFVVDMVTKAVQAEFALEGLRAPDFELKMTMNETVIPIDKEKEIESLDKAVELGYLTLEQARPKRLQLLDMEDIQ